jgi:hypothetical protein
MRKSDLLLVTMPGATAFAIAALLVIVAEFVPQPRRAIIDEVLITSLIVTCILWIVSTMANGLIKLGSALIKLKRLLLPLLSNR